MRDLLYGKLREETIEDIEMAKHNSDIARFARLHFHNHHEIFYIEQGIFKICAPKEIYAGEGERHHLRACKSRHGCQVRRCNGLYRN